ncbi:MAG: RNA 3'-phosphate cyclase [Nitrospiraceae bacterium]|nr:MAG: RNA 3'-phosphate cyclase [Nitrospiraceae bacterium]
MEIDGSFGEGGGQILRTALSLSCITGHALRLFNIRKGRKKPGLMPQHLTCVEAIKNICSADVTGNETGSTELAFVPGKIRPGDYLFDIKTAGSVSLVIQTLIPPLLFAVKPSSVTVIGGTHVPLSPPYDYISGIFIPMLNRLGLKVEASIGKYGFYPKGGGEVNFKIFPEEKIRGIDMVSRGGLLSLTGQSAVANLPVGIAERQRHSAMQNLLPLAANINVMEVPSFGHGTFLFLKGKYENISAGFSSLGERGKPAEAVGREAAEAFKEYHKTTACLDPHLADQSVIYFGLASEKSVFTTSRVTQHLMTNLWVIEKFLKITYEIKGSPDSEGEVVVHPAAC